MGQRVRRHGTGRFRGQRLDPEGRTCQRLKRRIIDLVDGPDQGEAVLAARVMVGGGARRQQGQGQRGVLGEHGEGLVRRDVLAHQERRRGFRQPNEPLELLRPLSAAGGDGDERRGAADEGDVVAVAGTIELHGGELGDDGTDRLIERNMVEREQVGMGAGGHWSVVRFEMRDVALMGIWMWSPNRLADGPAVLGGQPRQSDPLLLEGAFGRVTGPLARFGREVTAAQILAKPPRHVGVGPRRVDQFVDVRRSVQVGAQRRLLLKFVKGGPALLSFGKPGDVFEDIGSDLSGIDGVELEGDLDHVAQLVRLWVFETAQHRMAFFTLRVPVGAGHGRRKRDGDRGDRAEPDDGMELADVPGEGSRVLAVHKADEAFLLLPMVSR